MTEADVVLDIVGEGGWELMKSIPSPHLTNKANKEFAWIVRRNAVPFCDKVGNRQWNAPTAYEALKAAHEALSMVMPVPSKPVAWCVSLSGEYNFFKTRREAQRERVEYELSVDDDGDPQIAKPVYFSVEGAP